jgi:hypothetical protein
MDHSKDNFTNNYLIKIHIDMNNDEILKTIWKHKKERNRWSSLGSAQHHGALIDCTRAVSLPVMGHTRRWLVRFSQPTTRKVQKGIREVRKHQKVYVI